MKWLSEQQLFLLHKNFRGVGPKTISILSYNVCWECMTNTGDKGSAQVYGEKCKQLEKKTKYSCLNTHTSLIFTLEPFLV